MKLHKYTLTQLLDLALCSPEPGAVNFNILHAVILSLLNKLGIQEHKPWSDAEQPVALKSLLLTQGPSLARIGRTHSDSDLRDEDSSKESAGEEGSDVGKDWKAPTNLEIRMASKVDAPAGEKARIVKELWQATHLSRRVDATEDGIERLSSLMDTFLDDFQVLNHVVVDEMKPKFDEYFTSGFFDKFLERLNLLDEEVEIIKVEKASEKEQQKILAVVVDLKKLCDQMLEDLIKKADKEEVIPVVSSIQEKLTSWDDILETLPGKVANLETSCEEVTEKATTNHTRLDGLANNVAYIMDKLQNVGNTSEMEVQLLDIIEKLRRFQIDMDELNRATSTLIGDNTSRQLILEDLQHDLENLRVVKADKDDIYESLRQKADRALVEDKIDQKEFNGVVDEIHEHLQSLLEKLTYNEQTWKNALEDLNDAVVDKMSHSDYENLQAPIKNHIKGLWAKLKALHRLLNQSMHPSAAGVTKCISCGRPANLAGRDINISGGPDGMETQETHGRERMSVDVRGVSPYDPDSSGQSVVSLPDHLLRREVDLVGYDGRLYKGTVSVKRYETNDKDLNLSVRYMDDGSTSMIARPRPHSVMEPSSGRLSNVSNNRQAKRSKQTRQNDDLSSFPKTRYAGGKHTITQPLQKGLDQTKFVVQKRKSREDIGLMGFDKQMYKGSVRPKLPPAQANDDDTDVDIESEQMEQPQPSSRGKPVRNIEPRFCGGKHTMTAANQRGLAYAKMMIEDDPWEEDTYMVGSDKNVYKGVEFRDPTDPRSEVFSIASDRSHASVINMPSNTVRTQVDLVGSNGRIIKGCIVELPPEELKQAKRGKSNRKNIFLPTYQSSS